ncbi:MAG TPA: ABC transporter substrate-binding protein [Streptosporangiaceae bacterium]|nr:ABC transporter substrate-binding protein [Streptosporangiaceae bacterium]
MTAGPGRRRRAIPAVSAVGAALTLALAVTGCRIPGTGSSAAAPTHATITVAAQPGVATAPLYLGIRDGLFRQAGLTVKIQTANSVTAEMSALQKGTAQVVVGDYADFFFAQQQVSHPGFLLVADAYDAAPSVMQVLTLPTSGISSPKQLAGKTIGTSAPQAIPFSKTLPYSEETFATQSVLTNDGVNLKTVNWKPMATSQLVGALSSHQVDAIVATEPTIYQAETQVGATAVIDSCSGETDSLPLDGYFTNHTQGQRNHSAMVAFRTALLQSQAQAAATTPVQSVLASTAHMGKRTAALVTLGTYPTALAVGDIQRVPTLMNTFNRLSPLSVSNMVFH